MKIDLRIEAMSQILEDQGIKLSHEQIKTITDDFSHHLQMEQEMDSYAHVDSHKGECQKCKNLQWELDRANKEISIYNKSVKDRRGAYRVWIENGEVKYEH